MNISDDIRKMLHSLPNVVSVGWGRQYKDKDPRGEGIVVGVVIKIPIGKLNAKEIVPRVINDMPVDVQEVGAIKKFPLLYPLAYVSRVRPIQPGFSIGHPDVTAGTLGCFCINKNGEVCLLSNSHVIANSGAAKIGDPIYQPGVYDGGKAEDKIAELFSFTEIKMEGAPEVPDNCGKAKMLKKVIDVGLRAVGSRFRISFVAQPFAISNLVDCALARVTEANINPEIRDVGVISGVTEGTVGLKVHKSGRTTEHTHGEITQVEASVSVDYGAGQTAYFTDQLIAGAMCDGGDSGSAVLAEDNKIIGLLFAGGEGVTVINRIQNVIEAQEIKDFV